VANITDVDLSLRITRREEEARLIVAQERMLQLRLHLGGHLDEPRLGPPVCVVFEGWDAAGKGGAIRRLVAPLDARHVWVTGFSKPTPDEKRHHFLWRFWPSLPGWGGMAIFDRSWYGRVLVERVEGFATDAQWQRAYGEICEFERTLADDGMIFVKLWMHISHEEQGRRFERRARDPLKAWKLGEEDWRNREKRGPYEDALRDMLERTEHELAPWDVIEAEDKRWGRVKVLETVVARIEAGMRREGFEPPPELVTLSPHDIADPGASPAGQSGPAGQTSSAGQTGSDAPASDHADKEILDN
jgi:polyphosphate kinase 2 (PPK2 family)